jgi:hypothetical protein
MKNQFKILSSKIYFKDLLYYIFGFFVENIKLYFFVFGILFVIISRGSSTFDILIHNFWIFFIVFFLVHCLLSISNILWLFFINYRENVKYLSDTETEEEKDFFKISINTMLLSITMLSLIILTIYCLSNYFNLTNFKF